MRTTGFVELVDRGNFAPDIFAALEIARKYLDEREFD
jgi:hypothetical protein